MNFFSSDLQVPGVDRSVTVVGASTRLCPSRFVLFPLICVVEVLMSAVRGAGSLLTVRCPLWRGGSGLCLFRNTMRASMS